MKRNMDLIRNLLLQIEQAEKPLELSDFEFENFTDAEIHYHLKLLQGAGFIDASFTYADNELYFGTVSGLTWDGQNFLDNARSDKVWTQAKRAIKNTVGSTSFEVLKSVCAAVAIKLATAQI